VAEGLTDPVCVWLGVSDAERVIVGLKEGVCDSEGGLLEEGVPVGISLGLSVMEEVEEGLSVPDRLREGVADSVTDRLIEGEGERVADPVMDRVDDGLSVTDRLIEGEEERVADPVMEELSVPE